MKDRILDILSIFFAWALERMGFKDEWDYEDKHPSERDWW